MKSIKWQLIIILVAGLVVGLLLLSEQTGFRLVSPVPARGGIYTEGIVGSLQRLNPVLDYFNQADRDVNRLIFSSLIKYDSSGLPVPDLAQTWGISFDGLSYNFELHVDAAWHDGTHVTAEDILFTIDLMRDPDSVLPKDLKEFWSNVEVFVLGENAIQFRLSEPFAPFMDYLGFGILPKHLLGGMTYNQMINSEFNLNPIGSGPYKFEELILENDQIAGVILTANTDYYSNVPFLQEIVFRYFANSEEAYNAYLQGNINGIGLVDNNLIFDVLENPGLSVYSTIRPEISMVLLNLADDQSPFFQDKEIRRALLMGIDRRRIIDEILFGQGIIADVPVLPFSWAFYTGNQRVDQNNQLAIDYLIQNGYALEQENTGVRRKDGVELSFELVHPDDDYHTLIAEAIKSDLLKIGVGVQLVGVSYESLILDFLQPLTYEAALIDLNYYRSPDPDPYPFWDRSQQSGGQNYSGWEEPVVSQYLEEARISTDWEERSKLYRNFQVIFSEELPALPLFYPGYNFAIDNSIQGVRVGSFFDPGDRFWNVSEWFLIAQSSPDQ